MNTERHGMQQQEQREEWIRRHAWRATAMDQGEQRELPCNDRLVAEEMVGPCGDEEIPVGKSAPHAPRIVEGTLVESTVMVPRRRRRRLH